jgi:hypothetical protein
VALQIEKKKKREGTAFADNRTFFNLTLQLNALNSKNDPVTPSERNAPAFAFNAICLERLVPTDAKLAIFPVFEWNGK